MKPMYLTDSEKKRVEPCKGCVHLKSVSGFGYCGYLFDTGTMRNCAPGEACERKEKEKKKKMSRTVTWDTERGKQLYMSGVPDRAAAEELGVGIETYRTFAKRKGWRRKNGPTSVLQMLTENADVPRDVRAVQEFPNGAGEAPAGETTTAGAGCADAGNDAECGGAEVPEAERAEAREVETLSGADTIRMALRALNEAIDQTEAENEIFREALDCYGIDAQIFMAMEEMAELQKELCKERRGKDNADEIAEEIADVRIMLDQMAIYFEVSDRAEECRKEKVERLRRRLEEQ